MQNCQNDPLEQARISAAVPANIFLNQQIADCRLCPRILSGAKTGACSDVGADLSRILVVGESLCLDASDSVLFHAMDGTDGFNLLQSFWQDLGVRSDHIFYVNIVNCVGKITPNKTEIANCRRYADYAIRMVNPVAILVMGPMAMNAYWPDKSFHHTVGQTLDLLGIPAMVTYHPQHIYDFYDLYGESGSQELIQAMKAHLSTCLQPFKNSFQADKIFI